MNMLSIEGVSKEEKNLTLIDNLNLQLKDGQCIAIKCSEEITMLLVDIILGNVRPPKGNVYIEDTINHEYIKKYKRRINVIFREEGFYERLSVNEYLNFFHRVHDSKFELKEVMIRFALLDIAKNRISTLNYSQRKRISIARSLISNARILLIQEPTLNLDRESTLIIRESIPYMNSIGISIIAFSVSLEETLLLEGDSYTLDEMGFNPIETEIDDVENNVEEKEKKEEKEDSKSKADNGEEVEKFSLKIDKIPAKINEKIILFNPMEINYIETLDSICYLNVGGEKFPSSFTLTKLEERLKYFGFYRCHRSYLVNIQRVREVITWTRNSYSLILDDKKKSSIPLAKGRMDELKKILNL